MPSELNGAMRNNNDRKSKEPQSSDWQKDWLFLDDLKDTLTFLKMQEISYNRRRMRKLQEHRRRTQGSHDGKICDLPPFHDAWRPVMISWMYHIADTFRLMPIVVATGVYILDTCAWDLYNPSSRTYKQKELYPLMTMTALNMAVKCHETKMFPLDQLVQLLGAGGGSAADRSYRPEDVSAMERRLLHRCGWKLHCPTTHDYLLQFVTVLKEEYQGPVTSNAVNHLKRSLLWEHILHQDKKEAGLFSTSTMAYAAFLLGMEDAGLPLEDKQAACLALLEVANLSAQTPRLSEAYNWLCKAQSLQTQLEQGNDIRRKASVVVGDKDVPAHASPQRKRGEPTVDDSCTDQMSCETTQSHPVASSSDVAIVEPDDDEDDESDDDNGVADDQSTSVMSFGSSTTSDLSVIFCSYSSDGDAVEVVATDNISVEEEDDANESMDQSANVQVLPTVVEEEEQEAPAPNPAFDDVDDCEEEEDDEEEEPAKLVLSESLDEDGFEVSFESKHTDHLLNLVTSPREVSAEL